MLLINGYRKDIKMGSYIRCLKKYAEFHGRSSRAEFWGYSIVNAVIIFALLWFHSNYETGVIYYTTAYIAVIYIAATIVPTLAATVRRWHDIGRTGTWLFLNLIPGAGTLATLFFMLCKGDEYTNAYGKDPYAKARKRISKKR
jgi:uncharacterized membrane protein YhaH (DUF805 family)